MVRRSVWAPIAAIGGVAMIYASAHGQAQEASASSLNGPMTPAQVQALIPPFADAVPPSEVIGGAVGSQATIRRGDAVAPRITRAMTVTTDASGAFSGAWSSPLAVSPNVVLTPISATQNVDCRLTAVPTTTAFAGKCITTQALPVLTQLSGITLLTQIVTGVNGVISALTGYQTVIPVGAGMSVQVIAIPPTQ